MRKISEMGEAELSALSREIETALEERRRERDRPEREEARVDGAGGRWLRFEFANCGKCARCTSGRYVHGPYWYLYEYIGGKMRSTYVGRRISEEAARAHGTPGLAGKRPQDIYPAEVAERRATAQQR